MPELTDLSVIRTLCEKYDFALSKGFGQNFIINPGLPPKIVDASGVDKSWGVLEIGPGIGVLTKELAQRAAKVVSIEVDRGSGSSSQLEGTVLVPNTKDKTLMVQLTDGNVLTADVSDASFMSASGSSTSLRQLEVGDRVQLFGDYKGAQFVATLVLKL
mgnify:FL=1